ncbi:uncharacterized protein LY89DRAFT_12819 [Mollisia scopiformis]|uniref:Uncharacterized protein n=1 Tax=Mollisia scopiformis TaxID=149040 RepID=A0A194XUX0_MOLSC|nr:uncharacterized protein LY89DRAFT_12819 [Mollisia scopiformis]KUJ24120.1 hypothetical protein LY89DRAFT_12819 [Mollisia scopiformis]
MLNQGLAELCEKLTYSSSTVTPSLIGRESVIPSDVSTEIHHAASIWGNRTLQSGLETQLTQVVQNTFNNVMVEHGQENVVLPFGTGDHLSPRLGQFQERRGRRIVNSSNRVTRTPLGEMRCTVSTYRLDQDTTDLELEEVDSEENLEIETTFSLVPSWWIVKFGMARMFKFDIMQFSRQGWQATMSTFNLVPSDSAIFDFCREGNLNAVRSLLRHGKASTRDITPTGLTPLHVAASCCDVDICALLLREGADPSLREHSTFNMFVLSWSPLIRLFNRTLGHLLSLHVSRAIFHEIFIL